MTSIAPATVDSEDDGEEYVWCAMCKKYLMVNQMFDLHKSEQRAPSRLLVERKVELDQEKLKL